MLSSLIIFFAGFAAGSVFVKRPDIVEAAISLAKDKLNKALGRNTD